MSEKYVEGDLDSSLEAPAMAQRESVASSSRNLTDRFSLLKLNRSAVKIVVGVLGVLLVISALTVLLTRSTADQKDPTILDKAANYPVGTLAVDQDGSGAMALGNAERLTINGQLRANSGLVITPSAQPAAGIAGQVYFDQDTRQPYFYDGEQFINLVAPTPVSVTSLGGATGVVGLGNGVQITNGQLRLTDAILQAAAAFSGAAVSSVQGQTGAVVFSGGNGIAVNGTSISNTGLLSLGGAAGDLAIGRGLSVQGGALRSTVSLEAGTANLVITEDGNGNYTISDTSAGGGLPVTLGPVVVQSDTTNNTSININKVGTGDFLRFALSGTDTFVVSQNGVITNGTIAYSQVTGAPATTVTSLGGSSGAISLGAGLSIATNVLSNSGVVSITGTADQISTSAASGAVTLSLPQNIATTSSPSFNNLSLGGTLGVTGTTTLGGQLNTTGNASFGGTVTASGAVNLSSTLSVTGTTTLQNTAVNGTTTLGNTLSVTGATTLSSTLGVAAAATFGSTIAVQGGNVSLGVAGTTAGSLSFANISNTNLTTFTSLAPSGIGNAAIQIPSIAGGSTDQVCLLSLGNCIGTGSSVTSTGGAIGYVPVYDAVQNITSSNIFKSGTSIGINTSTPGAFALNVQGGNVNFSGSATVGSGLSVTGLTTLNGNTSVSGTSTFTVGTGGTSLGGTLGVTGATTLSTLSASGTAAFNGNVSVNGTSTLTVGTGATSLGGGLAVTGTTTLSGVLNVSAGVGIVATFSGRVSGADAVANNEFTTLGQVNSAISGASGNYIANSTALQTANFNISGSGQTGSFTTGSLTVSSNATVGGTLGITGLTTLNGGATIAGATSITGTTTINTTGTAATTIGNATSSFTLASSGLNVTAAGAISGVTGFSQTSGNFSQTGTGTFGTGTGAVALNGATTINSTATITGNTSISGASTLTVGTGATSLGGTLTVAGLTSLNGGVSVTGTSTLAGNVSVTGTSTFTVGTGAVTLGSLGTGIVQSGATGVLSSGTVDRNGALLTGQTSVANGGTGATTAAGARTNLGAAASGANSDITSLSAVTSVGSTGASLTLQGNGSSVFTATSGGFSTSLGFAGPTANVSYLLPTAAAGTYNICTSIGNCAGAGGGVTTAGGTTGTLALFNGSQTIGNSIVSQSGSTVTVGGTLAVNTIAPTAALLLGVTGQNLTMQGAAVSISSTAGLFTNTLSFATPAGSSKNITVPNASGTVAVSASGPLAIDANGNLTCASCTTSGGGATGAVDSLNAINGALTLQGTANQVTVTTNGVTKAITLSLPQDINTSSSPTFSSLSLTNNLSVTNAITAGSISTSGTLSVTGAATAASFNGLTLTANATGFSLAGGTAIRTVNVTANVTLNQDLSTTSSPTFSALSLTSALSVANGGTGATTAAGARTNLGAAASGANSDITSISGLTTALSVAQGGTGNTAYTTNGVVFYDGTRLISTAASTGPQCLISTGAGIAPSFGSCTTGTSSGVTSVNTFTGAVTIAGTANQVNIANATNTVTLSLPQDINTTSAVSFGRLSVVTATNPAVGSAVIFANNTNATPTGNLIDVQTGGVSRFSVSTAGAVVAAGSITSVGVNSGSGLIQGTGGLTVGGTTTLSGLAAGVVKAGAGGVLTSGTVALGTETTGNYIATLGALSGLSTTGNTGAGSTPTLSVTYGSTAGTSAQGNVSFTCPSGTGNLSGTGNAITIGAGGTCNSLTVVNNPTFSGLITANGGLSIAAGQTFTNAGSTLNTAVAIANLLTGGPIGTAAATVDGATAFNVSQTTAGQTLSLPAPTATTAGRIVYVNNTGTASFIMHGATVPAGEGRSFMWNGTAWTLMDNAVAGTGLTQSGNIINTAAATSVTNDTNITGSITSNVLTLGFTGTLAVTRGGTGASDPGTARVNLGAASRGANSDITSITGLTTALSVAQGGTGSTSYATSGVIYSDGTRLISTAASTGAQCLISATAGAAPTWGSCTTGTSSGVTSVNAFTGAITIAGTANQINVNNATNTVTLSLPQDINTTSAVSFGRLSVVTATNPGAGSALIFANNANAAPTGNLIDVQTGGVSRFSVSSTGAVVATSSISGVGINSGAGLIQGTGGLTVGGTITFSSLGAGVLKSSAAGLLSVGTVALGTETTGNYVASVGAGTGTTIGGTTGVGAIPTVNVTYGSTANTAAQGNVSFTCPSGTGNLTGTGNGITIGAGGTCNSLTVVNNPTFSGLVTANGGLAIPSGQNFSNSGSTLNTAVAIADRATGGAIGTAAATVDGATTFNVNQTTAGQTLSLPAPTTTTAGRIVYVNNTGATSFIMHGATIPAGESRSFMWNGTAWIIMNNTVAGTGLTQSGNVLNSAAATSVVNDTNITGSISSNVLTLGFTGTLAVTRGGTGASDAGTARVNLGAASRGANADITSLTGLTTALSVSQGGTGNTSFTTNGVLYFDGTRLVNTAASTGPQCLISTGTGVAPTFGSCATGTTTVNTVNGFSGTVTIAGTANQVNVANATNTVTLSLPQDINTTSAVNFGRLSVITATNPAAGSALIYANNTNAAPTGNLIDLQVGGVSRFSISSNGALVTSGSVTGVGINSGSGLIQGTGGLTVGGTVTLNALGAGVVKSSAGGVISVGTIALGSETTGNYVAALGTLTGLTTTGNTGAGSTPTLSVTYGSIAGTAAQGDTAISFTGTGNLTGTVSGTAGGGITGNTLAVVDNPTFTGLVRANGGLFIQSGRTFTNSASTLLTALSIADKPTGGVIGTAAATVDGATTFNVNQTTAGQTLSLPAPTTTTAGRIVYVNNIGTVGFTMHTASIFNGQGRSFMWNGTSWTLLDTMTAGPGLQSSGTIISSTAPTSVTNDTNITGSITSNVLTLGFTGTLAVARGGTGAADASTARVNLGAASRGANSDITSITGLTTALSVGQGGTGSTSYTTNGVIYSDGTRLISTAASTGAQCLISATAGAAPTWGSCTTGSSGVSSVNTFTGAVTIVGTANQVNVANATNTVTLSLPQDINTTSAVSFGQLNVVTATNPGAGSALIFANNTNASPTGNLIDVQTGGVSRFNVSSTGAVVATGSVTSVGVNSGAGLIQGTGGLTISGTTTLSSLGAGIVKSSAGGVLSAGSVALGTETTGNYVASLGAGTGTTIGGTTGAGAVPTVNVTYGSTANTAAQGNVSFTCPSGTGNLSGTGNSITIGTGGTCNSLTVVNNPTFSGLVTANGGLSVANGQTLTNAGATLSTAVAIANLATGGSIGTAAATVDGATTFNVLQTTAGQTLTLPAPTTTTAGRIVYVNNVGTANFQMHSIIIASGASNRFIWNGTAWIPGSGLIAGSGVSISGNLISSPAATSVTNDTNVTGSIASNVLTLGWTGTLAVARGGTGATTASTARVNLGAAASGANGDITSITGLTTALSVTQGGTGAATLTANGILFGNGTGAIGATAAGTTGQCLLANTAAAPSFGTCTGDGVGVTTVGAFNGGTANANGATISGTTIFLQSASASFAGLVDTAAQTFAGAKTFNGALTVAAGATVSAGQSITLVGGLTATRPAAPTEGMLYYDQTTKQLLVYANAKWQADRSTATKIVADGSTTPNSESADFVVPAAAVNAEVTINAAITALPASGGTVFLKEGTYTISGNITMLSNVTLMGSGAGTVIKIANASNASIHAIQALSKDRITIRDLKLDGNRANNTAGTQNGIFLNATGSGTGSTALPGAKISNVWAENFRNYGIQLTLSTRNNTITGVTAQNNGLYGFDIAGTNNVISNNTVQGNVNTGIVLSSAVTNTVTGNFIEGNGGKGIELSSASNNTIGSNTITSNASSGIMISGSPDNTITGNQINSNGGNGGIDISSSQRNTISGNVIELSTAEGIYMAAASNNNITGNTFLTNGGPGIALRIGSNNNNISQNRYFDNGGTGANSSILILSNSNNNSIVGNNITDTAGTGFAIDVNASGGAPVGNYLADNTFSGTGATAISDTASRTTYASQVDGSGSLINRNQGGFAVGKTSAGTSFDLQGAFRSVALPTPTAPTLATAGTTGTTSYSYAITALDGLGETLASTATTITTGNAILDATNRINITWTQVGGAVQYRVYRTASGGTPATTGLIATVASNVYTTSDTGLAATGAVPVANTTGSAVIAGTIQGGSLSITNNATIGGTLGVTGATTLNSTLTVTAGTGIVASFSGRVVGGDAVANNEFTTLSQVNALVGGVGGVTTVGGIDTQAKSANGAVISGANLYLQTADATSPGLVSTAAQTFAGAKTFSGNLVVSGTAATSLGGTLTVNGAATLGVSSTANGSLAFLNATNTNAVTLTSGATGTSYSLSLPLNTGGTGQCLELSSATALTFGNCGGGTGGANANKSLSNLTSPTAINQSLLAGTAGGINLGSAALPFGTLNLAGTSVTPGVNNFTITGAATAARTITLPDNSGTVCLTTSTNCGTVTGDGGVTTVGTLDGGTANANGATITGTSIFLQSASANFPGLVTTGAQTFAGTKTFNGFLGVAAVTGTDTISTTLNGLRTDSSQRLQADSNGSIILNIDTNNNDTDSVLAVRANATASDILSVNQLGQLLVNGQGTGTNTVATFQTNTGAAGYTEVAINNLTGAASFKNQISFRSAGVEKFAIGNDVNGNGSQNFFVYDNAAGATRLLLNSNGNLGIGTTAPAEKLNVYNGNLEVTYGNFKSNTIGAPGAPTVAVNATAGNLTGTQYYTVTFVTASGETDYSGISAAVTPTAQQVNISAIPTGLNGVVTARKIYRSTTNDFNAIFKLVTTINDNTTTTYTDNIAVASLGATVKNTNTTGGQFSVDGQKLLNFSTNSTDGNSFIGMQVGANVSGFQNTGVGTEALLNSVDATANTAIGYWSMRANTSGDFNTAVGSLSLQNNTTGGSNTAVGESSLRDNTSGELNTAVGQFTLTQNTTGVRNTALGVGALRFNTIGERNAALSSYALGNNTTGGFNTGAGYASLYSNTTGSYNTALGHSAGWYDFQAPTFFTRDNLQNATSIGYGSQVQASNSLILGGQGVNQVNVGIGTTMPSNVLSVSPVATYAGTAGTGGVSSTTVTGVGTAFTAAMVGSEIIFANGSAAATPVKATVTAVASATSLTVDVAITVAAGTAFRINYVGLQVTSAGNVGIGTIAPTQKLEVRGNIRLDQQILFDNNSFSQVQALNSLLDVGTLGANPFVVRTNNTERMRVDENGNVGIGIGSVNASSILEIAGAQTFRGVAAPTASAAGQGRIYFDSTANTFKVSQNGGAYDNLCLQTLANCGGAGSGVTTVGAFDGGTANANGATISGTTIYLQSATASVPGLVNTGSQTFAGFKTFTGQITMNGTSSSGSTLFNNVATLTTPGMGLSGIANSPTLQPAAGFSAASYYSRPTIATTATQTIPDFFGMQLDGAVKTGTGTVTNAYALQIQAPTIATTNYALYVSSGNNVFNNGVVTIGSSTANTGAKLLVDTDPGENQVALSVWQEDTTNNNNAVNIINAGTGRSLYVGDDGTTTDATPFLIDDTGNVAIGITTATRKLTVYDYNTTATKSELVNLFVDNVTSANNTNQFIALSVGNSVQPASATVQSGVVSGAFFGVTNNGAGTVTNSVSVAAQTMLGSNSGSITNGNAIQVYAPTRTGGTGTIGTQIGLNLGPQKTAFVTTAYGIYQGGASDYNYFEGKVGIGTISTPTELLEARGAGVSKVTVTSTSASTTEFGAVNANGYAAFGVAADGTTNVYAQKGITMTTDGDVGSGGTNAFRIKVGGFNDSQTRLRIASSGNVGIGNNIDATAQLQINTATGKTAFDVQGPANNSALKVDTTADSSNLITNGSIEANTTGYTTRTGTPLVQRTTAQKFRGNASLQFDSTAAGHGVNYPVTLTNGVTYTISYWAKGTDATSSMAFGYSQDGTTETTFTSGSSLATNGWNYDEFEFTPTAVSGTPYIFFKTTSATARSVYIDAVKLSATTLSNPFFDSKTVIDGVINSPVVLQNAENSEQAFAVFAAEGRRVLTVDTMDDVVQVGNTNGVTAKLTVLASTSGMDGLRVQQDSTGAILRLFDLSAEVFTVQDEGAVLLKNKTNSIAAFQVQNAAGTALLVADTTNQRLIVGDTTNGITLSPTTGFNASGTARKTKKIMLNAEYAGAVLDNAGLLNVAGTMTSGYDATARQNFYKWVTTSTSNQTYDVVTQIPIPADFDGFTATNPLGIAGRTTNLTNGLITMEIRGSNNAIVYSSDCTTQLTFAGPSITPTAINAWQTKNFSFCASGVNAPVFTAGDYLTIRVRMQANATATAADTQIGNIQLDYFSKF